MKTEMVIHTSSGVIKPRGPGQFIERIGRAIHKPVKHSFDDQVPIDLIEMGSMMDEDSLKFRKKILKMKEIYDVELLTEAPEHRQYRDAAVTHFGIQELQKFVKDMKPTIKEINGDIGMQEIDDLAIEFMKESGSDGELVFMKNSIIICTSEDFSIQLGEVHKTHKNSRMMCGVLFCSRPHRVVKATYTGKVSLR